MHQALLGTMLILVAGGHQQWNGGEGGYLYVPVNEYV